MTDFRLNEWLVKKHTLKVFFDAGSNREIFTFQVTRLHERYLPKHRLQGVSRLPCTIRGRTCEREGKAQQQHSSRDASTIRVHVTASSCCCFSPDHRLFSTIKMYRVICNTIYTTGRIVSWYLCHLLAVLCFYYCSAFSRCVCRVWFSFLFSFYEHPLLHVGKLLDDARKSSRLVMILRACLNEVRSISLIIKKDRRNKHTWKR